MSNEAKHTEGPWTASQTYPHGDWCIHSAGIPWQLAYVGASTQIDWPLAANAHLIAGAPDLLAACKCALGYFSGNMDGDWDISDDPVGLMRNAISKAEGRQP